MLKQLISFTALLLALSAIEFLLFPSQMLAIVGITSNEQLDFLLLSAGVGVVSLLPGLWAVRNDPASPVALPCLAG
jgi:hypothetical protein